MELTREQLRQLLLRETATLNEEDDSNFDAERVNIMLDYCIKEHILVSCVKYVKKNL